MAKAGLYYLISSTGAVVQLVKWLDDDNVVGDDQYLVREILSGEESPCWSSQFGKQLNEMEVLAYVAKERPCD